MISSQVDAAHDGLDNMSQRQNPNDYFVIFGGQNAICVLTGGYFDS